ncbi:hypothetical protein A4A49_53246 [Nicotiana attenuata]|uniref:Uncharacterized protein n=1 Tax=Nicotiana attenuata TaxID=49451 RepID=A0A1J6KG76_NICAT|nr:hypothetical protein A4A49_53246 [Nicotiana attenuata]
MKKEAPNEVLEGNVFPLLSLFNDLVATTIAKVASCSSNDYLNVKNSCKILNEISEDRQVVKNLSLELFDEDYWRPTHYLQKLDSLLEKYRESRSLV